jgi:hypothetical protein
MKSLLFAALIGLLVPIVVPIQALADCTTIPCQKTVKKKPRVVVKDKFACRVFDKASQSYEPCPVKKEPRVVVKDKFACRVFDKASQSYEPCPVKKKPRTVVKDKFACRVFDKASQSYEPCS